MEQAFTEVSPPAFSSQPDTAINLEDLSYRYEERAVKWGKTASLARPALDHVSLSVKAGEIFGLLGPNGGGKTTLFKILSTTFPLLQGSAEIFGDDLSKSPEMVRRKIGVVFQSPSLDKKLTLSENLTHQGRLYGLNGAPLRIKIKSLLLRVGLEERADDLVETLSGGMQRRLEIAKGLLHTPSLLLMDEPTTGLDPGARRDFWEMIFELKGSGMTILITTHLMEEAEKCGRIAILHEGRIVALGTPSALKEEIGGDVISIEAKEPQDLARHLKAKFGLEAIVLDRFVRIERDRGPEFVPQIVSSYPSEILSITVSKPTLEDVFVHRTGHRFWKERDE